LRKEKKFANDSYRMLRKLSKNSLADKFALKLCTPRKVVSLSN